MVTKLVSMKITMFKKASNAETSFMGSQLM